VKLSGPEENTTGRAVSRDCVSYGTRCISDSSGHAFDAWPRQIQNESYASASIVFIRLDREYFG